MNATDQAAIAADKLEAMLTMTYGPAGEAFRSMTDSAQESFMANCYDVLSEIRGALKQEMHAA